MKFFLGLWTLTLLIGCHNVPIKHPNATLNRENGRSQTYNTERDGAPSGPVPVTFKKIVPISEPMSRYGNRGDYSVNGKTYEVMSSAKGYHARGLASWYGTKFHAKRTSSGEEYNLYELTAAHKTLPLPTYVTVKNLENGKEAIVKVNDRGPFHNDRIIDLSYGAAVNLGLLPKGTAPVEIKALNVNDSGTDNVAHFYLQVGAFSTVNSAKLLVAKLSKLTPSPVLIEQYKEYFLVIVGPFANKQKSDHLKKVLVNNGVSGAFSFIK